MKKQFKNYLVIWAIALAIFNVIVFVTPNSAGGMSKFGGAFWAGYVFIMLSFLGHFALSFFFFREENKDKVFLNMSMFTLANSCLILSLVFGTLCMVIPNFPIWLGIIICAVILGFYAIAVFSAKAAVEAVTDLDKKVKVQTFFIKSITADADNLMAYAKTDEIKEECKKVYEALRFSDPMSNSVLADAEAQIQKQFNLFIDAVKSENLDNVKGVAEDLLIAIDGRNKKCKVLK